MEHLMLSLKWIRENTDALMDTLKRRGMDWDVSHLLQLDVDHRALLSQVQALQEERNTIAKTIPDLKKQGQDAADLVTRGNAIKIELSELESKETEMRESIDSQLHVLPNILAEDVPFGTHEEDNECIKTVGERRVFDFDPLTHELLGAKLGLMPLELATQMSGSRFVVLQGQLAKLERALGQFMLDTHTGKYGYEEVSPPLLVRKEAVFGVGQLPKFEEDLFKTTSGHYLISTAEVSLTNLVADQILSESELPKRFTALTPCFRSEAGAAGKDTKGMFRVHQFYKVELVSITEPSQASSEHERMLTAAEYILQQLGLPYRVMKLCSQDIGFCSHKTYDLEVWLPGQKAYREISSCSYFADYQARRMNARFRQNLEGGKNQIKLVHTLNGSGVAVGRALIAIMENYQQADGSIHIPEVLVPYTGFRVINGEKQ
jgi:seryl-tRNA synthetase